MTFSTFTERFFELRFLPKAQAYRTLRIAEALNDNDRDTLLDKLSIINSNFATLFEHQSQILADADTFLRAAKKSLHKVKNFLQEKNDRTNKLSSLDSKLQSV